MGDLVSVGRKHVQASCQVLSTNPHGGFQSCCKPAELELKDSH